MGNNLTPQEIVNELLADESVPAVLELIANTLQYEADMMVVDTAELYGRRLALVHSLTHLRNALKVWTPR